MPPPLAAALYRPAATLPGATVVPHATNAAGRAGVGIMWTGRAKQVYQNEWIFDKTTLQFIGERLYDPKTGPALARVVFHGRPQASRVLDERGIHYSTPRIRSRSGCRPRARSRTCPADRLATGCGMLTYSKPGKP